MDSSVTDMLQQQNQILIAENQALRQQVSLMQQPNVIILLPGQQQTLPPVVRANN